MNGSAKKTKMDETLADTTSKLAKFGAEIENLKDGVGSIKKRVEVFEIESRDSFSRLFDKLERATAPKETPWGVIFAGCGVLVAILTAIAGGGLTLILALAAWANAYFGDLISKAEAKGEQALQVHASGSATISGVRDSLSAIQAELAAAAKERDRLASQIDSFQRRLEDRSSISKSQ